MADVWRICIFVVLCAAGIGSTGIFTAKGFYCRDPDTGKLHAVNTTWPSTTFCGSYSCKLRRKNISESEFQAFRQINLTNPAKNPIQNTTNEQKVTRTSNTNFGPKTTLETINPFSVKDGNIEAIKEPLKHSSIDDKTVIKSTNTGTILKGAPKTVELSAMTKDGDRYLTEAEIKALTELLHAVKKSDLEAIVEIYNLAQDIYKEIDAVNDENLVEETIRDMKAKQKNRKDNKLRSDKNHVSYWYEPSSVANSKIQLPVSDNSKETPHTLSAANKIAPISKQKTSKDTQVESSDNKPQVITPNTTPPVITSPPKGYRYPSEYFRGTLTSDDFGKLPYYYPMSNFQRDYSYVHDQRTFGSQHNAIPHENHQNCKYLQNSNNQENYPPPSWLNRLVKKPFVVETERKSNQEYELRNRQISMLPYPLNYYQNYSVSSYPTSYYSGYPWTLVDLYQQHQTPAYVRAAYVAQIPHAILVNPELLSEKQNIIEVEQNTITELPLVDKNVVRKEEKMLPEWQTDPLPASVLEEVKANVPKPKLFPFPLRKKVKLERVGKVIKLEEFSRTKRDANNNDHTEVLEEYEVFIEKSMCNSDTEPGFFRIGNESQPYPACCPQRIGGR